MKFISTIAVALLALLTGCASQGDSKSDFSNSDLMFAAMMIPHHEQALEMSQLALNISDNPEVVALAQQIYDAQAPEIEEMKSWGNLEANSHEGHMMNGMLDDEELQQLRDAKGANFDRLFLEGMIKHHEGAIETAQMVVDSKNPRAASLGQAIIEGQGLEIEKMKELLQP